jgi:hypothetical protein
MKFIKNKILTLGLLLVVFGLMSCKKSKNTQEVEIDPPGAPSKTWQEHWQNHSMLVSRVYYDDNVVLYYDQFMDPTVTWTHKAMSDTWAYVKKNYGYMGEDPHLYVIFHNVVDETNPLGGGDVDGGHPSTYFDEGHDYRNVADNGLTDWTYPTGEQIGIPVHEIGHVVEGCSHGMHGSPSFTIWGDSKFMEIFNYDVLMNIGRQDEAARVVYDLSHRDPYAPYPGQRFPGTQWFSNWFFPIYNAYGKGAVLNRYFGVLADNYPKVGKEYTRDRDMNLGEFVHFWSGAAGANLNDQAKKAFGVHWTTDVQDEFKQAQIDFSNVKYPY